jgi:hypothetical protein
VCQRANSALRADGAAEDSGAQRSGAIQQLQQQNRTEQISRLNSPIRAGANTGVENLKQEVECRQITNTNPVSIVPHRGAPFFFCFDMCLFVPPYLHSLLSLPFKRHWQSLHAPAAQLLCVLDVWEDVELSCTMFAENKEAT